MLYVEKTERFGLIGYDPFFFPKQKGKEEGIKRKGRKTVTADQIVCFFFSIGYFFFFFF